MFTPPASPAPPRTLQNPFPSPEPSDDEELSQYLSVPQFVPPPRSSSLTLPAFSPPPPPLPPRLRPSKEREEHAASAEAKRRAGRRTRWTILLVPAVLVLITVSTRYVSHPAVFDVFSSDAPLNNWETIASMADLRVHKRHPSPATLVSSLILQTPSPSSAPSSAPSGSSSDSTSDGSSSLSASPATSDTPTQVIPTIPAQPPVLPTPFPQPLDETLNQNYSTIGCQTFFQNMTQSTAFRSCRPFSLLSQSSNQFLQAQSNITELNAIVWGTCNTNTSEDTCSSNMQWFTDNIRTQCAADLQDQNAIVQSTLIALEAYNLLRDTACLADQGTNEYCYVEAVANSNPADLYLYSLPLGIALPSTVKPSCSACTKSVMGQYVQNGMNLTALNEVYNGAASVVNKACGNGFATIASATSGGVHMAVVGRSEWTVLLGMMAAAMTSLVLL